MEEKMSLATMNERRRKEEVMMSDHTWSNQKHNVGEMHMMDLETTWMTQCYNMMHQGKDGIMQNDKRQNATK